MINLSRNLFCPLFFIGISTSLNADILPTEYRGFTLSPYNDSVIQMQSEKIEIFWGKVCRVEAIFTLVNPSPQTLTMKIGFPQYISGLHPSTSEQTDSINWTYDFKFNLNGENLTETEIPGTEASPSKDYWYGWTCKIKPYKNIVKLTYSVKTNPSYDYSWKRNLHYVLFTGKFWRGKIDTAKVIIHFPEKLSKDQILKETSPSGYEILEKSIRWTFNAFEPTEKSNIHLQIIDFSTFTAMTKYRTIFKERNTNNAVKLEAAKFYASLIPLKGVNLSAPWRFDSLYFHDEIIAHATESEKKLFLSTYTYVENSRSGGYYSVKEKKAFYENEEIQQPAKQFLNKIGYFEKVAYPEIFHFIEDSKRLFREVLVSEPQNAAAWKAYIANYYLIEAKGCNLLKANIVWTPPCDCPEDQKNVIKEAYSHCKNDRAIELLNNFISPENAVLPDTIGRLDTVKTIGPSAHGVEVGILMRKNTEAGYLCHFSLEDLALLKRKYGVSKENYLTLTIKNIDNSVKTEIVAILYRWHYYYYKLCRDLQQLK